MWDFRDTLVCFLKLGDQVVGLKQAAPLKEKDGHQTTARYEVWLERRQHLKWEEAFNFWYFEQFPCSNYISPTTVKLLFLVLVSCRMQTSYLNLRVIYNFLFLYFSIKKKFQIVRPMMSCWLICPCNLTLTLLAFNINCLTACDTGGKIKELRHLSLKALGKSLPKQRPIVE